MKTKPILIILGTIAIILIIANWNKIFGKGNKTSTSFARGGIVYGEKRINRYYVRPVGLNAPPINKEDCLCGSGKTIHCIGYKNCSSCCKDDNYVN